MATISTGNNLSDRRLIIRAGRASLAFAVQSVSDEDSGRQQDIVYEQYVVKSGVSLAANLREAFRKSDLLSEPASNRVKVLLDAPVLTVPIEVFTEDDMAEQFFHAFPDCRQEAVLYNVLPDLNAVAVFSINKDLKLVLDDHFKEVLVIVAVSPVWRHLHQRSYTGNRRKLYGYFHEKRLEVFSFQQNRFKFSNSFEVSRAHDALFFLLYVWKQLQLDARYDEMHIVGDVPEQEWVLAELKKYVQNAYVINPSADFNRAPATRIKGMPYDLQTFIVKGR